MSSSRDQITEAVLAFVNAQSWAESKQIVEAHSSALLTDDADELLADLLAQYRDNENATRQLEEYRALLARCRDEGIDAAFANRLHQPAAQRESELGALWEELGQLTKPSDMPRAVAVCQAALELVSRDSQPELWAALQGRLGNRLAQNPLGDRAQNIEDAIEHSELALKVYTRQDFPQDWAGIQNNLAIAYSDRIRGDRAQNIEEAIEHYELALEVYTLQDFPQGGWATTQHNLANAYLVRIRGKRAQNIEEAIEHYKLALEVYTRQDFPQDWAMTQNNLGEAYRQRIRGDRAQNLEQAIYHIEQALEVYTRQDFPQDWAMTQNNLGNAYLHRIRGDRAENLEQAIRHYEQGLEVYTRQDFPERWAMTQNNLANAYSDRIRGERAENLEEAIYHYEKALEVYTRQDFPEQWAATHNNLANAYLDRICGERTETLERAIHHYELALEVRTRQDFPQDWAMTQHNLANAYSDRIRGERAENLEEAIYHYQLALEVYTREDFPEQWATTLNNLANVYYQRIRGERADNPEEAIRHYQLALEVYTRETFPQDWAGTQNNLANAYSDRIRGERADNLEEAIHRYERALEVYTRQDFPEQWATAHNNLAAAYRDRIRGERAGNLEEAIEHYGLALEVYTRQDFPEQWAMTQNNLANACYQRIRGDRAANIEEAIRHYERALEIWTPASFPQDCRDTAYALGSLLYDERRFAEARIVLTTAHVAVEALRGEIQRRGAKRDLAEQNAILYAHLVHCCLLEGDEEAAFKYAVAGKGRAFVDMLATARFDLSAAGADDPELAEDLRKTQALHQQIDNLLAQLGGDGGTSTPGGGERRSPREMIAYLRALQTQEAALWDDMAYKHPVLTATQQAPSLTAEEVRALAEELGTTLVEYYRHADGWCAFVVIPDGLRYVPLPNVNDDLLERILRWLGRIALPAEHNKRSYKWLRQLHEAFIAPLRPYLPPDGKVVLAPFAWLHLLPLGAALDAATGRYATEDYRLAFAPSLAALRTMVEQARLTGPPTSRRTAERSLSVAYAGVPESQHYLRNVLPEAEAIARQFHHATMLQGEDATPDAVLAHAREQDVIHLSCHGSFDPEAPERSGLMLSGGWLTVRRIITEMRMDRTWLVTVSAAFSGQVGLRQGEEHVGLLQALMGAGARAVVTALWSVNDAATRAFFEAFYAGFVAGESPADALAGAARVVREHPGWEHPYYWAAFQVNGLAHGANGSGLARWPDDVVRHIEEAHEESERER